MSEITWSELKDAPVRNRPHGTTIWDLWEGDNGAKAIVVKIEAVAGLGNELFVDSVRFQPPALFVIDEIGDQDRIEQLGFDRRILNLQHIFDATVKVARHPIA